MKGSQPIADCPSIPSSPSPSADEPKPGSFTAIAEVGPRLLGDARASHDGLADPLPFVIRYTSSHPVGCSGLAFRELYANGLSLARVAEAMGMTGG
jgi:hypothetical protein